MVSLDELWGPEEEDEKQNRRTLHPAKVRRRAMENIVQMEREIYTERDIDIPEPVDNDDTAIVKRSSEQDTRLIRRLDDLVDHLLDEVNELINEGAGSAQAPYLSALNKWFDTCIKTRALMRGQVTERVGVDVKGGRVTTIDRIKILRRQLLEGLENGDGNEEEVEETTTIRSAGDGSRRALPSGKSSEIIEVRGRTLPDAGDGLGEPVDTRRRERRDREESPPTGVSKKRR